MTDRNVNLNGETRRSAPFFMRQRNPTYVGERQQTSQLHPPSTPLPIPTGLLGLFFKAVLIQYEILAGSNGKQDRATSSSSTSSSTAAAPSSSSPNNEAIGFQPLTSSGEKLVDEITGLLGGDSLQGMGRKLMADLKNKMGSVNPPSIPPSPPGAQQHQQPRDVQGSDPKAKYMERVRVCDLHAGLLYVLDFPS